MNAINSWKTALIKNLSRSTSNKTFLLNITSKLCKEVRKPSSFYIRNFTTQCFHPAFTSQTEILENLKSRANQLLSNDSRISALTDTELQDVIVELRSLSTETQFDNSEDLKKFAALIQKECLERCKSWDVETLTKILSAYSPKANTLAVEVLYFALKNRLKAALKSTKPIMMRYLEILNYYNCWRWYFVNPFVLECALAKRLDELNIQELGVLLHARNVFRARLVNNELTYKLSNRLVADAEQVDIATLEKFILCLARQRTTHLLKDTNYDHLFPIIVDKLDQLPLRFNEDIIKIFLFSRKCPFLLEKISQNLLRHLPNITVFDLVRTISSMIRAGYSSKEFYNKVLEACEQEPLKSELTKYPRKFVPLISSLSLIDIYPFNYIDKILSKDFLVSVYGRNKNINRFNLSYEVLTLNCNVLLERPDYKGNFLDPALCEHMLKHTAKHLHHSLKQKSDCSENAETEYNDKSRYEVSWYNKILLETRSTLYYLVGGEEYVHTCYVLPHLRKPNLLFSLNKQKAAVKLPNNILQSVAVKSHCPNQSLNWIVVTFLHKDYNSGGPSVTGSENAKIRILKKLGYHVIFVLKEDWIRLSDHERCIYLNNAIKCL